MDRIEERNQVNRMYLDPLIVSSLSVWAKNMSHGRPFRMEYCIADGFLVLDVMRADLPELIASTKIRIYSQWP